MLKSNRPTVPVKRQDPMRQARNMAIFAIWMVIGVPLLFFLIPVMGALLEASVCMAVAFALFLMVLLIVVSESLHRRLHSEVEQKAKADALLAAPIEPVDLEGTYVLTSDGEVIEVAEDEVPSSARSFRLDDDDDSSAQM